MKKVTEGNHRVSGSNNVPKKVFVVLIFLLAQLFFFTSDFFRLHAVEIEGMEHVKGPELVAFSELQWGRHLWLLDLRKYHDRIVQMLWVEDVRLSKIYPGTLKVEIRERHPSICVASADAPAVWYGADREGLVLLKMPDDLVAGYPRLILDDKIVKGSLLDRERINEVLDFIALLPSGLREKVGVFMLDGGGYLSFHYRPLTKDIEVKVGRPEQMKEKLEIFSSMIEQMKGSLQYIEYIDLRYSEPVVKVVRPAAGKNAGRGGADRNGGGTLVSEGASEENAENTQGR